MTHKHMKKTTLALAILGGLILIFSFQLETIYPSKKIKNRLVDEITAYKADISNFATNSSQQSLKENLQLFKQLRFSYKTLEPYFVYMYPGINKSINGAPVPSFYTDVVKAHKDNPTGLQVIEELLHESPIDYTAIKEQCRQINLSLDQAKVFLSRAGLHDWEVLEANKVELVQLTTVTITGFDSPILLQSIAETEVAFKQVHEDISLYYNLVPPSKKHVVSTTDSLFVLGEEFLAKNKDFNSFDRFFFTKDIIEPLYKSLIELHSATGYEQYHEVSSLPRGFNHMAKGIFAEDFLNPLFSTRGNQKPSKDVIDLGRVLFFDPILSGNNKRACASCHQPSKGFGDGERKSIAFDFEGTVDRNSPTIINAAYQNNFFWDMRSNDLNNQIEFVAHSEKEFNTDFDEMMSKINASLEYREAFKNAYPNSTDIGIGKVKEALGAYVRSIRGMNSTFDQAIRGEREASKEIVEGYNLFMGEAGCGTCHFAPAFNGTVPPHFDDTEGEVLGVPATKENKELDADLGRYGRFNLRYPEFTFLKGMVKTPTVRNVQVTAPYMHNGCYDSLEEVVDFYDDGGGLGLGFDVPSQTLPEDELGLSKKQQASIVAFLNALTDTTGLNTIPRSLPAFGIDSLDNRKIGGEY